MSMTKEQEIIERLNRFKTIKVLYGNTFAMHIEQLKTVQEDIETVLSMLKEKDKEIEKKDNAVRKIIKRLDNDINRIAKSKAKNRWDDYRRCRLKAYKTKTREIKEYIEEQYFERKSEQF